ncbi:MAG TPA: NAD(P)-dependent alcohol dehydrogenase [Polyangiaceae bacterium]|nr:NAD(P)-dependent alcohol dehydrogenase [Polyangiaceae bacterium]
MRAVVYTKYGPADVLSIEEWPTPEVGDDDVLVRVHAAALNPKDCLVRKGKYKVITGRRFPRLLGYDYAGEVMECGRSVRHLSVGDKVFGMIQSWSGGACADYVVARASECAPMPASLGWEEAAAIPLAGQTALQALRDIGGVQPGMRVLINGASGGVGTFAIQIAKILGAQVTAIASAANHAFCRELGADETIDYREQSPFSGSATYDVVFDVFGNRSPSEVLPVLRSPGTMVTTVPSMKTALGVARTLLTRRRVRFVYVRSKAADLVTLASYVEQGKLAPVVQEVFPLSEVRAASMQIETKRTRGKIVLRVQRA